MDRETRFELCRNLAQMDGAVYFLVVIIASVLLSLRALLLQRGQLQDALAGRPAEAPSVFPLRLTAGALVIGALGFFLQLALGTLRAAEAGEDGAARRSARTNALASVLVLGAALLRLDDLLFVAGNAQAAPAGGGDLPA